MTDKVRSFIGVMAIVIGIGWMMGIEPQIGLAAFLLWFGIKATEWRG